MQRIWDNPFKIASIGWNRHTLTDQHRDLPVFDVLRGSIQILAQNPGVALRIAWLPALVIAAAEGWLRPGVFAFQANLANLEGIESLSDLSHAFPSNAGQGVLLLLAMIIAMSVIVSGFLRWIVKGELPGFAVADFGPPEIRLILSWFATGAIVFAALVIFSVIGAVATVVIGSILPPAAPLLTILVNIANLFLALTIVVRLSLTGALMAQSDRWALRESWQLTSGQTTRLISLWLLVFAPVFLMQSFVQFAVLPSDFGVTPSGDDAAVPNLVLSQSQNLQISVLSYLISLPAWAVYSTIGAIAVRHLTATGSPTPQN